ncbi:unnamed protein product, partial [marine sediment metagenome]
MATTWYVDPANGDNSHSGTSEGEAVEQIVYAYDNLSTDGDTIVCMDGEYDDAQFPGSWFSQKITLKAQNERGAYVNRSGSASPWAIAFRPSNG